MPCNDCSAWYGVKLSQKTAFLGVFPAICRYVFLAIENMVPNVFCWHYILSRERIMIPL